MYDSRLTEALVEIKSCIHCGELCDDGVVTSGNLHFCCSGCQSVYDILQGAELNQYYCLTSAPGKKQLIQPVKYPVLDKPEVARRITRFQDESILKGAFYLPSIHCSSCIWLLENLYKFNSAILHSTVNFTEKTIYFSIKYNTFSLRQLAELLSSIGYDPQIDLDSQHTKTDISKTQLIRLGIVGFCFANIMLLSFPEYLGLSRQNDPILTQVFRWLNLGLSIPVAIIAGKVFFFNAFKALKQSMISIDLTVSIAISVTFFRSIIEISSESGMGYLDSMSGIVFFMMLGRYIQDKTYTKLQFNRKANSFFPISVDVICDNGETQATYIQDIKQDDIILVRRDEVIPIDGEVQDGESVIDYSFITGESNPTSAVKGLLIYAGGKILTNALKIKVIKSFSKSDFLQLWNNETFQQNEGGTYSWTDRVAAIFTIGVMAIALLAFIYWWPVSTTSAWDSFTSVLIVACPCALLLSSTYTLGFLAYRLGLAGFFVKNSKVIESVASVDHLIFDKTGTLTITNDSEVRLIRGDWSEKERIAAVSLMNLSLHPLSQAIVRSALPFNKLDVSSWQEIKGKGLEGWVNDQHIKIGSAEFVCQRNLKGLESEVYISFDGHLKGKYEITNKIRPHIIEMLNKFPAKSLTLLSGDSSAMQSRLEAVFPQQMTYFFDQSPQQKLDFVKSRQTMNENVVMIGDGLNDAGALQQSDVGIAVINQLGAFVPACKVIINGDRLKFLYQFIEACRYSKYLIIITFIYSLMYNIIGLYFAVSHSLLPVIAAILMPLSSIGVIFISFIGTQFLCRHFLKR